MPRAPRAHSRTARQPSGVWDEAQGQSRTRNRGLAGHRRRDRAALRGGGRRSRHRQPRQRGGDRRSRRPPAGRYPPRRRGRARRALATFGTVDILVNNAAIIRSKPVEENTEEDWDDHLDLNLKAPFFLARALCLELARHNINVNTLSPGNIVTPMNENLRADPARCAEVRTRTPTGQDFLPAEDMAGCAVFLASDDARSVHGANVMVDAGWSAW